MDEKLAAGFWQRNLGAPGQTAQESSWADEVAYLYQNGISMEEALRYLQFERPGLPDFIEWISRNSKKQDTTGSHSASVFSSEMLDFFHQNGYIVLESAITAEAALQTQQAIWDFLGKSPNDPASWYTTHPAQQGLMVQFSDHHTLNENRESLRIKAAFEQLYDSKAIYKTVDKISFNPPVLENYYFMGSPLHWDVSLKQPIPFRLQGLIYLSDCGDNDGAFHCVPGFQHQVKAWMENLPKGTDPRNAAIENLIPVPIAAKAGDMVIWQQALPHCASPNYGKTPRLVQYLSYFPVSYQDQEEWI